MIVKDGKIAHPLRQSKITLGTNTIHDRLTPRARAWFILDLALPGQNFIPAGSAGLITADGLIFGDKSRRENK